MTIFVEKEGINMPLQITVKHFKVSDDTREMIRGKVRKLRKYFANIKDVELLLSQEKARIRAELGVKVNRGYLVANVEEYDLKAALDSVLEKIERQLIKHKSKIYGNKKHLKNHRVQGFEEEVGEDDLG